MVMKPVVVKKTVEPPKFKMLLVHDDWTEVRKLRRIALNFNIDAIYNTPEFV